MYTRAQSRETDPTVLIEAMRDMQLATLVTSAAAELAAAHVPMVVRSDGDSVVLEAHVARPNPLWRLLATPLPALAAFQGPQAYVSPSWYPSKGEHGKVVPTWNYVAVHAHGTLTAVHDEAWLRRHLDELTASNERHRERPWAVSDAPDPFITSLARAIVGLRLDVDRLEGTWKMNQHRPPADRAGTISGLERSPEPEAHRVAAVMRGLEASRSTRNVSGD